MSVDQYASNHQSVKIDAPFAMVPLWLLDAVADDGSGPSAIITYVALHKWTSGSDRSCYPSRKRISEVTGRHVTTVTKALALLESVGAITIRPQYNSSGDRTSNHYTLHLTDRNIRPGGSAHTSGVDAPTHGGGSAHASGVVAPTHQEPDPMNQTHPTRPNEPDRRPAATTQLALVAESVPARSSVPQFDAWYERFPKKQGKADARKRWAKMSADDRRSAWAALDGWERYANADGNTFVPMASTWLNQRRWEDDAPAPEETRAKPTRLKGRAGIERFMARNATTNQGAIEQ
jgi:hypothetical protein